MRTVKQFVPLALFGAAVTMQACGSVKLEDQEPPFGRKFPVSGAIRGTVLYQGEAPCSANGHIIGNALLLLFDRRNPPPPNGLANTVTNFTVVSGDTLFAGQPRSQTSNVVCPGGVVTASAPYAVGPLDPGSYYIQAFYDRSGDFLPTFKFRNLPKQGDVGGGAIDTADPFVQIDDPDPTHNIKLADGGTIQPKIAKRDDANYQPVFIPVDVGIRGAVPADSKRGVPTFTLPPEGYVAENVTVSIGAVLPLTRPYFWPSGSTTDSRFPLDPAESDVPAKDPKPTDANPDANIDYAPIVTITQDHHVLAQPNPLTESNVDTYQQSFVHLRLNWGLPPSELAVGTDTTDVKNPFHFQIKKFGEGGGIHVWWNGTHAGLGGAIDEDRIPEGKIPRLWPLVVLAKLKADPTHKGDPQSLVAQGSDGKEPIVIIQGITLAGDSLFKTTISPPPFKPDATTLQDHVTVLLRPSAVCLDPRKVDRGGVLVTPHDTGDVPNQPGKTGPLVDPTVLAASAELKPILRDFRLGCLPLGRYGINMVYPTGQAWTTPNESGSCAAVEGENLFQDNPGSCAKTPRPVLYSQGNRAVVEVVPAADPNACNERPVPTECISLQ
jgi:hypothetical protein